MRDPRWANVFASVEPSEEFGQSMVRFHIQIRIDGQLVGLNAIRSESEMNDTYVDVYKLTLDRMVLELDKHLETIA